MIFFLISCFSFILLSKSLSLKQNRQMKSEWSLLSPWFWKELTSIFISWLQKGRRICISFRQISVKKKMKMNKMKNNLESKSEKVEEDKISLLDLPDLTLECILERLSPSGLCSMAGVCSNLRDRCKSDHFWEKHMKKKWGRVIGDAAYREWQWHIASVNRERFMNQEKQTGFSFFSIFGSFSSICSLSWIKTKKLDNCNSGDDDRFRSSSCIPVDSIMGWFVSLESGRFWFPAQVYNRENGHVGFMLSCYDAQLSYDWQTNTFRARYAHHGRRTVEENIEWDRIRAPLVDTPPHVLHTSDCLNDLKPGDHVEIQWRRNKEFPYGWWYGVVGHLESCSRNENHCHCCYNDEVILEFKQYPDGSRWRQTKINRKGHREVGNEADGFYGGIRKLYRTEEISIWKSFWPAQALQ